MRNIIGVEINDSQGNAVTDNCKMKVNIFGLSVSKCSLKLYVIKINPKHA